MTLNLRDQRVDVFAYSDTGADGMPGSTYTYTTTYWARKEPSGARESLVAQSSEHEVDWVFTFGDDAVISGDGIVRHAGMYYRITGVYPSRTARAVVVHAVQASGDIVDSVVGAP